jgi:uncharacterized Zn-binding protein involved in type VI secretion
MPQVVRVGDINEAGGKVTDGAETVKVNGITVCTHVSGVTPHPTGGIHTSARTTRGSSTVFAEGKPVVFVGVKDTCGHTRVVGSTDVYVGE